jgi:hypothetical protein
VNLLSPPFPPIPARDSADVRSRLHFEPRLPAPLVLGSPPRLSTTFSVAAGTTVKTADLELALQKSGVTGMTVPPEWDGAQLALHTSGVAIAEWKDLALVQSLPLTLTAPPGFDFAAYSATILRILGVSPDEARRLADRAGTSPAWLLPLSRDRQTWRGLRIEEVVLNSGRGILAIDTQRVTLLWSVPDRVYVLTGTASRDLVIAVANSVQ